jgi:hypothetical protein
MGHKLIVPGMSLFTYANVFAPPCVQRQSNWFRKFQPSSHNTISMSEMTHCITVEVCPPDGLHGASNPPAPLLVGDTKPLSYKVALRGIFDVIGRMKRQCPGTNNGPLNHGYLTRQAVDIICHRRYIFVHSPRFTVRFGKTRFDDLDFGCRRGHIGYELNVVVFV